MMSFAGVLVMLAIATALGQTLYHFVPQLAIYVTNHWTGMMVWLLPLLISALVFASVLVPLVFALIEQVFAMRGGNKILGVLCALLMGGPVTWAHCVNSVNNLYGGPFASFSWVLFGGVLFGVFTGVIIIVLCDGEPPSAEPKKTL